MLSNVRASREPDATRLAVVKDLHQLLPESNEIKAHALRACTGSEMASSSSSSITSSSSANTSSSSSRS
eukprot:9400655-Pyramimonas_sp.AAC.1